MVRSEDALERTRQLTNHEGIFAGLSSGAAVHVAVRVGSQMERGNIVVLLADGGWKYLSTGIWERTTDEAADRIRGRVMW